MHNISHEIKGDKLIVTIDIGDGAVKAAPPSSSGKTMLVATTGGALPLAVKHANLSMAINITAKR
jgi:hypothetical protein